MAAELCALGSRRFEVEPEDVTLADGMLRARDGQAVAYADLLRWAGMPHIEALREYKVESGLNEQGGAAAHWHQGAGACEIEVDVETGKLTIARYAGASWAGKVVNPVRARAQDQGNIIYGIGPALYEEMLFDHGQVINANLGDYLIPSFLDIPPVLRTTSLESQHADADMHGIGEMTLPCVAPALANALYDALGIRIRTLPLTAERILQALEIQATPAAHIDDAET